MRTYSVRENEISHRIIGCAIEAQKSLGGPGLLESIYEDALVWELTHAGLAWERQKPLPISYKGDVLAHPLKIDLVVEDIVIVECKSVEEMHPVFKAQAATYLRLTGLRLALVINFGSKMLTKGVARVANGIPDELR